MSDDTDRYGQDSEALLNRADTLLARHKGGGATGAEIPVLTETIETAVAVVATAIPTLTDIVTPQPSAAPLVTPVLQRPEQNLEHAVYQKLRQQFDRQSLTPEITAALDQAIRKVSGELKGDIDAMVRASVEEILRSQAKGEREAFSSATKISPSSTAPKLK